MFRTVARLASLATRNGMAAGAAFTGGGAVTGGSTRSSAAACGSKAADLYALGSHSQRRTMQLDSRNRLRRLRGVISLFHLAATTHQPLQAIRPMLP